MKSLDHKTIEQEEFVEKYVLHQLTPEETEAFEAHFFECDECFEKVKLTQKVVYGIKQAVKEGSKQEQPSQQTFEKKIINIFSQPAFSIAAVVLILILSYPAIRGIWLQQQIKELRTPKPIVYSFTLEESNTRSIENIFSAGTSSPVMLEIPKNAEFFMLSFTILESSTSNQAYRAQIVNQNKQVIWETKRLKGSGEFGIYSILCPSSFFSDGAYLLKVEELDEKNQPTDETYLFPFTVKFK